MSGYTASARLTVVELQRRQRRCHVGGFAEVGDVSFLLLQGGATLAREL